MTFQRNRYSVVPVRANRQRHHDESRARLFVIGVIVGMIIVVLLIV